MPRIQRNIASLNDFAELLRNNTGYVVIKLSATWCAPCKQLEPFFNQFIPHMPDNVTIVYLDVDESGEVSKLLRNKRIYSAIPTIIAYKKENYDIYPDEVLVGGDRKQVERLMNFIKGEANLI